MSKPIHAIERIANGTLDFLLIAGFYGPQLNLTCVPREGWLVYICPRGRSDIERCAISAYAHAQDARGADAVLRRRAQRKQGRQAERMTRVADD